MFKCFNKLIATVTAVILAVSALGVTASAGSAAKLTVGTASGTAGTNVSVNVTVENFSSVCGMQLFVDYTGLTFVSATSTAVTLTKDENYSTKNGTVFAFTETGEAGSITDTINPLFTTASTILTLTFKIPSSATLNQKYDLTVLTATPNKTMFADTNVKDITSSVTTVNGSVTCNKVAPAIKFNDVGSSEWYYDAVNYCSSKGIMTGTSTGVFSPAQTLNRAQFAAIIYRVAGSPAYTNSRTFPDVPAGTWFTDPVLWANSKGIINGYQNGYYGATDNITREQMAVIMYNYAKFKGYNTSVTKQITGFSDYGSVSSWAATPLSWAYSNGIITGKDGGTRLDPGGSTLRCECAAIINRFLVKFGEE